MTQIVAIPATALELNCFFAGGSVNGADAAVLLGKTLVCSTEADSGA